MKHNIGMFDRIARLLVSLVIVTLYVSDYVNGTPGLILMIVAGILTTTSFVGLCPIYLMLGISSKRKHS